MAAQGEQTKELEEFVAAVLMDSKVSRRWRWRRRRRRRRQEEEEEEEEHRGIDRSWGKQKQQKKFKKNKQKINKRAFCILILHIANELWLLDRAFGNLF